MKKEKEIFKITVPKRAEENTSALQDAHLKLNRLVSNYFDTLFLGAEVLGFAKQADRVFPRRIDTGKIRIYEYGLTDSPLWGRCESTVSLEQLKGVVSEIQKLFDAAASAKL